MSRPLMLAAVPTRRRLTLGFLAALIVTASGAPPALATNQSVTVVDSDYIARTVAVMPGESVTWTYPSGGDHHNVHFDDNLFIEPGSPSSPFWTAARTFQTNGMYRYHCDEHGGPGGQGMSGIVYVNASGTLPPNAAPTASFFVSPGVAAVGRPVAFNASTSSDSDGNIVRYEWDLDGNGSYETDTGTQPTTTRSYPAVGTTTVGLRVTDSGGLAGVTTRSVEVTNPPTAALTVSPSPALPGQTVSFDGSASSKPGGSIAKYEWDLDGNGTFETYTATTPVTSRVYSTPAALSVGLRVTDNLGVTGETTRTLQIDAPPVVAPPPAAEPGPGSQPGTPQPVARTPRLSSSVSYTATARRQYTLLTSLSVRGARAGSTVRLSCTGKGCPFTTKTRRVTKNALKLDLLSLVRGKRLRAGARLEIRVTRPGTIGVVRRLTIRAGRSPKSESLCLSPGAAKPAACPA